MLRYSLVTVFALTVLSSQALAGRFEKNCKYLSEEFGTAPLSYSYTNFQNATVTVTPTYEVTLPFCVSDSDVVSVVATNASKTISMTFVGRADVNGTISYEAPLNSVGNCADVGANNFANSLRSQGVPVTDEIMNDIRVSYTDRACPALREELKVRLNAAAARANARP